MQELIIFSWHSPWMQLALDPGIFTREAELHVRSLTVVHKIEFKLTGQGTEVGCLYCVKLDAQLGEVDPVQLTEDLNKLFMRVDAISDEKKQEVAAQVARMFAKPKGESE